MSNYFATVSDYVKRAGIYNIICVMLGDKFGVSLDTICNVESLDNIGSYFYSNQRLVATP